MRFAELDAKLTRGRSDRLGRDLLDPIDNREAERTAAAVQAAEEQNRDGPRTAVDRRPLGNARRTLLDFQA